MNRYEMTLREWMNYTVPMHEIIYNSSVDDIDMKTMNVKSDAFIPESIGVSFSCTMGNIYDLSLQFEKTNKHEKTLLCAFSPGTERGRRARKDVNRMIIQNTLNDKGFNNRVIGCKYWNELNNYKFVASPEGNGIQCHRTYEALYWKCIPIVEDNSLTVNQLKGLPILFTHNFKEISNEYLENKYTEMMDKKYDFSFLFLSSYSKERQELIKRRGNYWCNFKNRKNWWEPNLNSIDKCQDMYKDVNIITLTNNGYKQLTLNCIKSLNNINKNIKLKVFCLDEEAKHEISKTCNMDCELFLYKNSNLNNNIDFSRGSSFEDKNWSSVTIQKLFLIHQELLKSNFVLFTDGDIVYKNEVFLPYLYRKMLENTNIDMLIQTDWVGGANDLCTGFFIVRKNNKTLDFFNPETIIRNMNKNTKKWRDDQVYINYFKKTLNIIELPIDKFPNGRYFYNKEPKSPFLVHFNYLKGISTKQNKMKQYNMWYE